MDRVVSPDGAWRWDGARWVANPPRSGRAADVLTAVLLAGAATFFGLFAVVYFTWAAVYWLERSSLAPTFACLGIALLPLLVAGLAWRWTTKRGDPPVLRVQLVGAISLAFNVTLLAILVVLTAGVP